MIDLTELRRLAKAALAECGGLTWWLSGKLSVRAGSSRWVCKANWDGAAAAKHIVSFDPTVSLALLDRLERAEAEAASLRGLLAATPAASPLPPIEREGSREYIPLPGGWEIQTKGDGSSYRLCDTKTGERLNILGGDGPTAQDFVTRMAKEVHAASLLAAIPAVSPVVTDEMVEAASAAFQGMLNRMAVSFEANEDDADQAVFNYTDAMRAALEAALKVKETAND